MVKALHRRLGNILKVCRLAHPLPVTLNVLNLKSTSRLRQTVEDYYCAKFQVIAIRDFRLIVLTYTPTYIPTYIHRDRVIAISAPPYYVVGAD